MFIRARKRTLKNGQERRSFALIQAQRVNGKPKNLTLLNLGKEFNIAEEDWRELTQQVVARLKGQTRLPYKEDDQDFQNAVDDIVERLQDNDYDVYAKPPDTRDTILTDEIRHRDSRTVAGERLAVEAMECLGIPEILRTLNFSETHVQLACAMIVGRMLNPGSDRATHQWMVNSSSILEILELNVPGLNSLYRCSDELHKHSHEIMDRLYGNTKELFDCDETLIFYDLTNTFYHGQEKGELLRYGRSKQKRNDCPLVTLALTLDGSGFPRSAEILPGNVGEPGTLKQAIENLKGATPTVIMDAGIATEKNIAYLKKKKLNWICVQRTQASAVPTREADQAFETAGGVKIRAWELSKQDMKTQESEPNEGKSEENELEDQERFVYVHSEARQATEEQILETKCADYEEALTKLHEGLSKPKYLKNYEKVLVKIGRLREKYKKVSHTYQVTVTRKKGTKHAESVRFTKLEVHEDRLLAAGGYILRTSLIDWPLEDVARAYWRLTEIENTFRVMKSDLGLRPIYHSKDERIEGHLFITVLAYHVAHSVRTKLKKDGIHDSWDTIRNELNKVKRITTVLPKSRYRYILTNVDQDLTPRLEKIFLHLGFNYDPDATRTKQEYTDPKVPPNQPPPDS